MQIRHAHVAGAAGRPSLSLGEVAPGVAAYAAATADDASCVAGLVAHLLLGANDPRWARSRWATGEARLAAVHGELLLRREGSAAAPRLTLAPTADRTPGAPPPSPEEWRGELPAEVAAAVFFAAPHDAHPLRLLLSESVAAEYNRLAGRRRDGSTPADAPQRAPKALLDRRDDLAARIESLLAARREEGATIDGSLPKLESDREAAVARCDELRRRLRAVADELETDGARMRYAELSRVARQAEDRQAADEWAPRVEELDAEVARWRATLEELESREAEVRAELALVHPDDSSPAVLLADQRASVAVARRLVADLEAEVARFAGGERVAEHAAADAHPRMNPLVETLAEHLDRLADLVGQQGDALRTQELLDEAAQLERSQVELRRQLEHLLQRRQTLWRSSRARAEKPVDRLATPDPAFDRAAAQRRHAALAVELETAERELGGIDRALREVVSRRRRLLDSDQLSAWQRELDAVQAELSRWAEAPAASPRGGVRASDVLARLTDGELVELRLAPGGRSVEVRDRGGVVRAERHLTFGETRLVAWALRLALADAAHAADAGWTLVLDDPFADLDGRHAANLATAIDDYARRGRQVVVLALAGPGLDRLRSLGVAVRPLGAEVPVAAEATPRRRTVTEPVVTERIVSRKLLLDVDDPIARFPVQLPGRDAAFARARLRTVGDLVMADPSAVAEELAVDGVTAELVALWQAHCALVCFTPGLDLASAKLLVDCDVLSVEQLADASSERLAEALRRRGAAASVRDRVGEWITVARGELDRWRSRGYADAWRRNRAERRDRIRENAHRRSAGGRRLTTGDGGVERSERPTRADRADRGERRKRRRKRSTGEGESTLRFYLEPGADIEAAPSIGPKRAERLAAIGVATVTDLLEGDPERIAAELDDSRVDAATIVAWQHQAGLVCRVPGLRGHDAQVLVGCGFTTPEDIASMKPSELLEFVEPFCDTPEGQRALRGSSRPDLKEVGEWIEGARQRRSLTLA
ncbi:MAG: DUF4332 domain-containing protein [Planctomycetota bacterium]